jgi:hypothetical protein
VARTHKINIKQQPTGPSASFEFRAAFCARARTLKNPARRFADEDVDKLMLESEIAILRRADY